MERPKKFVQHEDRTNFFANAKYKESPQLDSHRLSKTWDQPSQTFH